MKKSTLGIILGFTMIGIGIYLLLNHKMLYTIVSSFILGWSLMDFGCYIADKIKN